jgi:hypothetical protein
MDDIGRLRRTIRRCTAVLVGSLGLATWAISDIGSARVGFVLALPAALYLAASLVYAPESAGESDTASAE